MAIRFSCRHCNTGLSIASRKMGSTIVCPRCGGSVVVPDWAPQQQSPESKGLTLPADIIEKDWRTDAPPLLAKEPSISGTGDHSKTTRRRRPPRNPRIAVKISLAVVLGICAVAIGAFLLFGTKKLAEQQLFGPSRTGSLDDLVEHLKTRKLGELMQYSREDGIRTAWMGNENGAPVYLVFDFESERKAKEFDGQIKYAIRVNNENPRVKSAEQQFFQWGRFCFSCMDPKYADRLKQELGTK